LILQSLLFDFVGSSCSETVNYYLLAKTEFETGSWYLDNCNWVLNS